MTQIRGLQPPHSPRRQSLWRDFGRRSCEETCGFRISRRRQGVEKVGRALSKWTLGCRAWRSLTIDWRAVRIRSAICRRHVRPRSATDAARPRRRGARTRAWFAAIAHSRLWHEAAVRKCPLLRRLWGLTSSRTRLEHDWGCCYQLAVQVTTAADDTEEGLMTVYVQAHVGRKTEVPGVIELLDETKHLNCSQLVN